MKQGTYPRRQPQGRDDTTEVSLLGNNDPVDEVIVSRQKSKSSSSSERWYLPGNVFRKRRGEAVMLKAQNGPPVTSIHVPPAKSRDTRDADEEFDGSRTERASMKSKDKKRDEREKSEENSIVVVDPAQADATRRRSSLSSRTPQSGNKPTKNNKANNKTSTILIQRSNTTNSKKMTEIPTLSSFVSDMVTSLINTREEKVCAHCMALVYKDAAHVRRGTPYALEELQVQYSHKACYVERRKVEAAWNAVVDELEKIFDNARRAKKQQMTKKKSSQQQQLQDNKNLEKKKEQAPASRSKPIIKENQVRARRAPPPSPQTKAAGGKYRRVLSSKNKKFYSYEYSSQW